MRRGLASVLVLSGILAAVVAPATAEVTVVVVAGMSGSTDYTGKALEHGATKAAEAINAAGGVLGETIDVVAVDDGCDGEKAMMAAREAMAAHPRLIVGHSCSAPSIRVAPIYAGAGIVQILPTATNPRLTEMGIDTLFRLSGRDDRRGAAVAELIARRWPGSPIAVVNDDSLYGRGLADAVRQGLAERRMPVAVTSAYTRDAADFGDLIRQLAAQHIRVLYVGGYVPDAAQMMVEIRRAGLDVQVLAGDGGGDGAIIDKKAGADGEGLLVLQWPDLTALPAAADLVAAAHRQGFAIAADGILTYAAVQIWAAAVRRAGSLETPAVAAALHDGQFDSVIGRVGFDSHGEIIGPSNAWAWSRWSHGRFVPEPP